MSTTLPVVVRYEGKGRATRPDWHLSDLVAIFPTEPGTNDPWSMTCYSTVGEHSSCHTSYMLATKPATKEQVQAMLQVLKGRGYENLKVVSRVTKHHLKARKQQLGVR